MLRAARLGRLDAVLLVGGAAATGDFGCWFALAPRCSRRSLPCFALVSTPAPAPGPSAVRRRRPQRSARRRHHRGDPRRGQSADRGGNDPLVHAGAAGRSVRPRPARSQPEDAVRDRPVFRRQSARARAIRWSCMWWRTRSSTALPSRATASSTTMSCARSCSLRPRSVFTPAIAQSDRQRILDLYARRGRFAARVDVEDHQAVAEPRRRGVRDQRRRRARWSRASPSSATTPSARAG